MTDTPIPVVMTDRQGAPAEGSTLETPSGKPNVVVRLMTPLAQILVRTARTYVQSLIGFLPLVLGASYFGLQMEPMDFLQKIGVAAGWAIAPALIAFIMNLAELLARLDETKWAKARA